MNVERLLGSLPDTASRAVQVLTQRDLTWTLWGQVVGVILFLGLGKETRRYKSKQDRTGHKGHSSFPLVLFAYVCVHAQKTKVDVGCLSQSLFSFGDSLSMNLELIDFVQWPD